MLTEQQLAALKADVLAAAFDRIDPRAEKELRDAAFHLLRHAVALTRDRVPLTADRLGEA